MPEDLISKSIEMELIQSELNEAQIIKAKETTDALAKVMSEFREARAHINADGRLNPEGKQGDLADLRMRSDSRLAQIGDDRLSSLDKRISELEYLVRPQAPEVDPQLELMKQQEVRQMLADHDELQLMEMYIGLSVSGENDLVMRSIEQSPIPLISDLSVTEAGKRTRGERQNKESALTLKQLRTVRNTIASTLNAYRGELNLPNATIQNIAQVGVA